MVLSAPFPAYRTPSVAGGEGEGGYEAVPRRRGQWERGGSKGSLKGFCSSVKICERENSQRASCVRFSQRNTEEQNAQGCTFPLRHKQRSRGNLGDHAPPFGGGEGGGAANQ